MFTQKFSPSQSPIYVVGSCNTNTKETFFPGVFFIIPCVDIYEKIDMRTQTFDVPPQEVMKQDLNAVVDDFQGFKG